MEGKALTERLAFTCRLLLDRRVLELKSENDRLRSFQQLSKKLADENERLKLALFVEKHSPARLQLLMGEVNMSASENDQCNCLWCYDRSDNVIVRGACKFKPYFESCLKQCGLTVEVVQDDELFDRSAKQQEFFDDVVYDIDAHFVQARVSTWLSCPYGAKIWKATSADDPELAKLARLFEMLRQRIIDNES